MRRFHGLLIGACLAVASAPAVAGPWGALPDAVAKLQINPGDRAAERVVGEAEASILNEARNGRLAAVAALMEVYASLVMRLPNGDERIRLIEQRAAATLTTYGQIRRGNDLRAAATAWTMAANLDRSEAPVRLLRQVLLPPADAEAGAVWTSPLDGAMLVYQPPSRVRVGCSELDRRCRDRQRFNRLPVGQRHHNLPRGCPRQRNACLRKDEGRRLVLRSSR